MSIDQRETELEAVQAAAKEQLCLRLADITLRECLSKDRIEEMQPVYPAICGYAGRIIGFASDIRKYSDDNAPYREFVFELAQLGPEDSQLDTALQRVLRKLSQTEESELPNVFDWDGEPIGISSWEISIGDVVMTVRRKRALSSGEAPVYFSVEHVGSRVDVPEEGSIADLENVTESLEVL